MPSVGHRDGKERPMILCRRHIDLTAETILGILTLSYGEAVIAINAHPIHAWSGKLEVSQRFKGASSVKSVAPGIPGKSESAYPLFVVKFPPLRRPCWLG